MDEYSYQEIMWNLKRLCKSQGESGCSDCKMSKHPICCKVLTDLTKEDIKSAETIIAQWAKENPENPIYPTWQEWLTSIGLMETSPNLGFRFTNRIPDSIARQFGIKPKGDI